MDRAGLTDRPQIEAFLARNSELAMFPRSNLARHGMQGGHPNAVSFWISRQAGAICDVLTLTEAGTVMPCLPSGRFAAAARALRGAVVGGIVGPKVASRGIEAATGLTGTARTLDRDEPHFVLDLADLALPDGPGRIVPLADAPKQTMKGWMLDYETGTLCTPAEITVQRVQGRYDQCIAAGSHVVLMAGDEPLSMAGFNAQLPDIVQIGGVYTPPHLRGLGHARRAVALQLDRARAAGVRRATLFSASDMAARAYRSIGFRQIGEWTLLMFRGRTVIDV